jgi:large subunit ribosomal protein L25
MAETLDVQIRTSRGKRQARKQRRSGVIPAVLYGHGEGTVSLSVPAEQLEAALRHGSRVVELRGAVNDIALIKELQWDTWGTHVLHLDFARVSKDETVEVESPIVLRGEAPGQREGGVLQHLLHSARIRCLVTAIPEKLEVSINHLQLNQALAVRDLVPPPGVEILADKDEIVVQCSPPAEEKEEEPVAAEGAEPEVIGRKAAEEEEAEET